MRPGVQGFQPEFYLSDWNLRTAEELVGQYELGRAESLDPNNPISSQAFRGKRLARTRALSKFVVGLAYNALVPEKTNSTDSGDPAEDR